MISPADIEMLDRLQAKQNDGRGVTCVQSIVAFLRRGDEELARNTREVEGDKTRMYPEIEAKLLEMFGCRLHGKHDCDNWICERLR